MFWGLWFGLNYVLDALDIQSFTILGPEKRQLIIRDVIHLTHHIGISAICIWFFLTSCKDDDIWPSLESDWTYLRWFVEPECRMRPYEILMSGCIFTLCYLIWDTCRLLFFEKKLQLLDKQMLVHHFLASVALYGPWIGWCMTGHGLIPLAMEISSIPLVLRRYIPEDYKKLTKCNQIIFFVCFTVFRIIMCMYLHTIWPGDLCRSYDKMSVKWVGWFHWMAATLLTMMQFFWYSIIIKTVFCKKAEAQQGEAAPTSMKKMN